MQIFDKEFYLNKLNNDKDELYKVFFAYLEKANDLKSNKNYVKFLINKAVEYKLHEDLINILNEK